MPRASGWWLLLLVWFHSPFLDFSFSFQFVGWLLGERRAPPRLRASALLSHLSLSRRGLVKRRGMTQSLQFDWRLSALQAKFRPEEIHPKEKCQFLPTSALWVWGTIRSNRMAASCDNFWVDLPDSSAGFLFTGTYGLGGPVLSTMRGVEIRLSPDSICRILDIPSVGFWVYEAKAWPTVLGFEPREAV